MKTAKPKNKGTTEEVFTEIKVEGKKKPIIAKGKFQKKEKIPSIYPANILWSFYFNGKKLKIVGSFFGKEGREVDQVFIPDWNDLKYPKHKANKISKNRWKVKYKTMSGIHLDDFFWEKIEAIFDVDKMEVYWKRMG